MANTNSNQHVGGTGAGSQQRTNSSNSTPGLRPTQNQIPLPHYFIVRPGTVKHTASGTVTTPGPIVPLVAVDQLPEWLDLLGVPRELSVEQTVGLRNLGTTVRNPEFYQVYMHNDLQATPATHKEDYITQTEKVQRDQAQGTNDSRLAPIDTPTISAEEGSTASSRVNPVSEPSTITSGLRIQATSNSNLHARPDKTRPNSSNNNTTTSLHPRFPSPTVAGSTPPTNPYPFIPVSVSAPVPFLPSWYPPSTCPSPFTATSRPKPHPKHPPRTTNAHNHSHTHSHTNGSPSSTYCKHWCHRGTCRWGAQCRYAHEMPTTAAGLRDVGLAHHPAWYTTAVNMAFGPGGFAGTTSRAGWCPPGLREREKEKKSAGAGAGKGKGLELGLDGKSSGGDGDGDGITTEEAEQRKEDAAEEKGSAANGQGQKDPEVVEKLVEI
ncbi:hypothetical protein F4814DRAFT_459466 [Daldinia grandis]|nr:hypothetical protein F4814DRAFT_459466 [Daldinia grandis]